MGTARTANPAAQQTIDTIALTAYAVSTPPSVADIQPSGDGAMMAITRRASVTTLGVESVVRGAACWAHEHAQQVGTRSNLHSSLRRRGRAARYRRAAKALSEQNSRVSSRLQMIHWSESQSRNVAASTAVTEP